ncbi:MAG: efflux RND transporter periplasmic adaptor subunit [Saprospiraceae bacterium]|nr:efflux RND transporter periplasmic adaptor subunit [Saprospiraceae bacterium]
MKFFLSLFFAIFLISCGNKENTPVNAALETKLKELETLKNQSKEISAKINNLENEIETLDPSRGAKPKLVGTIKLTTEGFEHYINLQGVVNANSVSYIAPRNGMGGYVKQLYIRAGDRVTKGQAIMKLDDQVLRQAIEATKTQLNFAKNLYERTKSLWAENIGSEVQLLSAKNNVEALESQIKVQEEQLKTFVVLADQNGVADIVNVKVGELFTGMSITGPQIQIVGTNDLAVSVEIPENYSTDVKIGNKVKLEIPALGKTITSTVSRLTNSINAASRGFTAECKVPVGSGVKPNMAVSVKILSHANTKAIVVPVNIIQSDEKGKYVYVLNPNADGKAVAKKKNVTLGQLYAEKIEILSGLAADDEIIVQGYQNLYEGQRIQANN